MLKVLDVEGAVRARRHALGARAGQRLGLRRRALRARHRAAPRASRRRWRAFGADGRCLMRALQEELDDPDAAGLRALRGLHRRRASPAPLDPALVREAALHLRSRPLVLEVKKMAPDADGRDEQDRPRTCAPRRAARWRASATAAGTRWSQAGRARGGFDDELVGGRGRGACAPGAPPVGVGRRRAVARARGDARAGLRAAARRGARAAVRAPLLERVGDRPPQREMANSAQQVGQRARRVRGRRPRRRPGAVPARRRRPLLAAGRWRWSAGQLRRRGASAVYPLALATAF